MSPVECAVFGIPLNPPKQASRLGNSHCSIPTLLLPAPSQALLFIRIRKLYSFHRKLLYYVLVWRATAPVVVTAAATLTAAVGLIYKHDFSTSQTLTLPGCGWTNADLCEIQVSFYNHEGKLSTGDLTGHVSHVWWPCEMMWLKALSTDCSEQIKTALCLKWSFITDFLCLLPDPPLFPIKPANKKCTSTLMLGQN